MKFGGTSVATAERMTALAEIVRGRRDRRPIVIVSALAGVTDLLEKIVEDAAAGDLEAIEPRMAELERRHRWAVSGGVEASAARHDLSLEVDALFEELQQLLRSVRLLGEVTPRARDVLLGFGENLSSRIVAAVLREHGLPACWLDATEVVVTDARHGSAVPDVEAVRSRAEERLLPAVEDGQIPVLGGFTGATAEGVPTTLGRGGSDTSATVLGCALGAEEVQIWSDVDGLMTADPRWVGAARTLERVSFCEAAELTFYGARILHPAAVAPAVERGIGVRVLNSMNPNCEGTLIVDDGTDVEPGLTGVASRSGLRALRVVSPRLRMDPGLCSRVLDALAGLGAGVDLVLASEIGVTVGVSRDVDSRALSTALDGTRVDTVVDGPCGLVCLVGTALSSEPVVRAEALDAFASMSPEIVAVGGSPNTVVGLVREAQLRSAVVGVHRRFFERRGPRP